MESVFEVFIQNFEVVHFFHLPLIPKIVLTFQFTNVLILSLFE